MRLSQLNANDQARIRQRLLQQGEPMALVGLRVAQPKHVGRGGRAPEDSVQEIRALRVVVSVVSFRHTGVDADNLRHKALQDAIAQSLGLDDGDQRIKFEYSQHVTTGPEGTLVKIAVNQGRGKM